VPEIDPSALTPLILFALWAVVLQLLLAFARAGAMRRDKSAVNSFKPTGDTEQLKTFSRAHMNTVEIPRVRGGRSERALGRCGCAYRRARMVLLGRAPGTVHDPYRFALGERGAAAR
jgi:hypothetical protein